jgi:hypothetical protein
LLSLELLPADRREGTRISGIRDRVADPDVRDARDGDDVARAHLVDLLP